MFTVHICFSSFVFSFNRITFVKCKMFEFFFHSVLILCLILINAPAENIGGKFAFLFIKILNHSRLFFTFPFQRSQSNIEWRERWILSMPMEQMNFGIYEWAKKRSQYLSIKKYSAFSNSFTFRSNRSHSKIKITTTIILHSKANSKDERNITYEISTKIRLNCC